MHMVDHEGIVLDVLDEHDLFTALAKRDDQDRNHFWIGEKVSADSQTFPPCLSVAVRRGLASLWYLPDSDVGESFVSKGRLETLNPDEMTEFLVEGDPHHPVPNYQVVSFDTALNVALEFFRRPGTLPRCVDWEEL